MEELIEFLPMLLPLFVIQLVLMIVGLIAFFKTEETRGPKWVWLLLILALSMIGPILFFIFGRRTE